MPPFDRTVSHREIMYQKIHIYSSSIQMRPYKEHIRNRMIRSFLIFQSNGVPTKSCLVNARAKCTLSDFVDKMIKFDRILDKKF